MKGQIEELLIAILTDHLDPFESNTHSKWITENNTLLLGKRGTEGMLKLIKTWENINFQYI